MVKIVDRGTTKPYIHFLSNASIDVTGSMHLVRFKKYVILLDCGLIQQGDIATAYRLNQAQLKKIKPRDIDYIILSHQHIDHSGLIPALFAKGCQAHVYVPQGSVPFLRLLWQDSLKIMQADCLKLQKKHGIKAAPFYTEEDVERAVWRCIDIPSNTPYNITNDIKFTYYPAGHILYAQQILLELKEGSVIKRVAFTGDIGGTTLRPYVEPRQTLPFCNVLIGENTYNQPGRINNVRDREQDETKIATIINNSHRILFPCFSLGRTQELLTVLYDMWQHQDLPLNIPIYLDSPLAIKFCDLWPDFPKWQTIMNWSNLHFVKDYQDSIELQMSNERCVVIAASGFLQGGRIVSHLKTALLDEHNHICFIGFSGENNLASQIKSGQKDVVIDGVAVANRANITDLRSFSSHASREELMDYYSECRFDKLCLVHGQFSTKVDFAQELQDRLHNEANSAKVVCINQDQRIFI